MPKRLLTPLISIAAKNSRAALAGGQRVDRDGDVLDGGGGDHQDVEDLVVAEDLRPGIGLAARVDDRAGRVEDAAERDQADADRPDLVPELRQADDRDPAGAQVDHGGDPVGGGDPDQVEDQPAQGRRPDHDQHHVRQRPVHDEQGEGRVGARDEDEDHRVVEAAHPLPDLGRPGDAVIERAGPEHRREREGVDRHRDHGRGATGGEDQGSAGAERDEERPLMGDAAQPRLLRELVGGRVGGHRGSLASGGDLLARRIASRAEPFAGCTGCIASGPERIGAGLRSIGRHLAQP